MAAVAGKRTPRGHDSEVEARRLMGENEELKVTNNEQEERLKRLSTKLAKMESEISLHQRKLGAAVAAQQGAKGRGGGGQRDEELERLQALVGAKERANEAVRKQLQIIKFTPTSAYGASHRRPLSATSADAAKKRHKAPPVGGAVSKQAMSRAKGMLSDTTETEAYQIVSALQLELDRCKTRLRKAQDEEKERLVEKAAVAQGKHNRWDNENVDALKMAVKEFVAKTTIMMATEEHTVKSLKDKEVQLEAMMKENDGLRIQETSLRSRTADLTHQKQLLELRKDKEKLESKEMDEIQKELGTMNEENATLRKAAFKAGQKKVQVKKLSEEQKALEEETLKLRQEVDDLVSINVAMERDLNKIETEGPDSINALEKLIDTISSQCKYLERHTSTLKEKLETFVGHGSLDFMDPESVKQAKLLAKRTGLPIFMRSGGAGPEDQLNGLRKEIRRLRVANASELREIGKLKEMIHLQAHIAKQREIYGTEGSKLATKARHEWDKKLNAVKYRLSIVEGKNARLRMQLSQQQIVPPALAPPAPWASSKPLAGKKPSPLRPHDLAAGRSVVVIAAANLVLERGFGDFAAEEPCTLLLADFYLHDTQYSQPMLGIAPAGVLRREMEVLVDSTFLAYLRDEALVVQLLRVRGAEFEPLASLRVPLAELLEGKQDSVELKACELKTNAGVLVGRVDVSAEIQGSIAKEAKAFNEAAAEGGVQEAVGRIRDASDKAPFRAAGGVEVLEAMSRTVGSSYALTVRVVSLSDVRAGALMAFTMAGGPRARLYTMHQLLEFDVAETDSVKVLDGTTASFFNKGSARYVVPCDAEWDKRLLGHRLEFCVLDESDFAGEAYVGMASLLLSPLLSRRGMRASLSLFDPDGQVSGTLKIEVAWEPEAIPVRMPKGAAYRHVVFAILKAVRVLGGGEGPASALFQQMLGRGGQGAGGALDEVAWVEAVQEEADRFARPTDAEVIELFHSMCVGGARPRVVREDTFVAAVAAWQAEMGDQLAAEEAQAALKAKDEAIAMSRSVQQWPGGDKVVRLKVSGVVLREAMRRESGEVAELRLRAVCAGGDGLEAEESARFDNSEACGGFASFEVEWGRTEAQEKALRRSMQDGGEEEGCVEVQLWWPDAPGKQGGEMLGRWRMKLSDLAVRGDVESERVELVAMVDSSTSAAGFKVGDMLAGVDVQVTGKAAVLGLST